MGASSAIADEYDALMAEVLGFAESCSDDEWSVICPNEQRTAGVLFDHIAVGNPLAMGWVEEFLAGRPVRITPDVLHASNADHARNVLARPRAGTVNDLKEGTAEMSRFLRGLTDDQLKLVNEFGWAGRQNAEWLAGAAVRHPRSHLKSIRDALGR